MNPVSPIYRSVKSWAQYKCYKNYLLKLLDVKDKSEEDQNSVDLLISLIGKWDADHQMASDPVSKMSRLNCVETLERLIRENNLTPSELASRLGISQSRISDILYYGQELTEDLISKISQLFNLSGDVFRSVRNPMSVSH
jgi:antitoxin component HigA of HigAB toxin-antitoxin module